MDKAELAQRMNAFAEKFWKMARYFDDHSHDWPWQNKEQQNEMKRWAEDRRKEGTSLLQGLEQVRPAIPIPLSNALWEASWLLAELYRHGDLKCGNVWPSERFRRVAEKIERSVPKDWNTGQALTMSVPDTAEYLGLSTAHVYKLINVGKLRTLPDTKLPLKSSVEAYKAKCQPKKKRNPKAPAAQARRNINRLLNCP